jgi:hypothetical protein
MKEHSDNSSSEALKTAVSHKLREWWECMDAQNKCHDVQNAACSSVSI